MQYKNSGILKYISHKGPNLTYKTSQLIFIEKEGLGPQVISEYDPL